MHQHLDLMTGNGSAMKVLAFAATCLALVNCSGSEALNGGSGGTISAGGEQGTVGGTTMASTTGGMTMTGGSPSSTGGSMSSGGMENTGGAKATGGMMATGGMVATGGSKAAGGCTGVSLTVKNYLAWCSVSVAADAASSAAQQTVCVAPGIVDLTATALAGFQLGSAPWHGTVGDTGSGSLGTVTGTGQSAKSSTTVNVSTSPACVWVCCEFAGGGGCPASNQCP